MWQINNHSKILKIGFKVIYWLKQIIEIEKYANENVVRLLVGNKNDLESKREVTFEEGKELADSLNIKFIGILWEIIFISKETSAKNSINVEKAFMTLATEIKAKVAKNEKLAP